jgi:nitrate/nitrite transporter NarK
VVSPLLAFLSATIIVMAGFLAAAAVLALLVAGLPISYACLALFAVLGLVQGASFAAVPELNDTIEGQALSHGAIAQMGNLGNTLGTPVLLLILDQAGLAGLLSAVIVIYAAGCIVHIVLAYLRSLQPTNEASF